jgi:NADPH:quinone reductase-like Zn-dependent oxidoreductase
MESERIEVAAAGGPEVLVVKRWTPRALSPGEVRVRVDYAGVSFGDVMLRRHVFRDVPAPAVPGYDVVGTVDASADARVPVGARVAAFTEYGGYARHAIVPAASLVPVPEGVDGAAAAATILNYATADAMLTLADAPAGDAVLVRGARGGVGTALVDLARVRGWAPIAAARSPRAPLEIDEEARDFEAAVRARAPGGVAAAFDGRGSSMAQSHRVVRRGGRLVIYGLSGASQRSFASRITFAWSLLTLARLRLLGGGRSTRLFAIDRMFRRDPGAVRDLVAAQIARLGRGEIAPVIGAVMPLEEAPRAHELLERGGVAGKIVLRVGG